jgi:hypothetical protein
MIRIPLLAAAVTLGLAAPTLGIAASKSEQAQVFQSAESFTVQGTVLKAESDELEVNRQAQSLPPIELDLIAQRTQITVDGELATPQDLLPGMEVRAEFQIAGDDIIATKVEATSSGGQQGSQPGGQRQQQLPAY